MYQKLLEFYHLLKSDAKHFNNFLIITASYKVQNISAVFPSLYICHILHTRVGQFFRI